MKIRNDFIKTAEKLIPKLVKTYTPKKTQSESLLKLIKALLLISSKKYLSKVINKNLTKMLKKKNDNNITNETLPRILKNMEILSLAVESYDFSESELNFTLRFVNIFLGEQSSI